LTGYGADAEKRQIEQTCAMADNAEYIFGFAEQPAGAYSPDVQNELWPAPPKRPCSYGDVHFCQAAPVEPRPDWQYPVVV
jgi:hypothetical protein